MGERTLAKLAPMLPLTVAGLLIRAIGQAAQAVGFTRVSIGSGLEIVGVEPEPGGSVEYHLIDIRRVGGDASSSWTWTCTCYESSEFVMSTVGGAVDVALVHVPAGESWGVSPARVRSATEGVSGGAS